jgi:hypothetical protein
MKTAIKPLIKNKVGDSSAIINYRPIAIVTVMSQIFEIILLDHLAVYLHTNTRQFGSKITTRQIYVSLLSIIF